MKASFQYEKMIVTTEQVKALAKDTGVPIKLVDTCNFNNYDIAYQCWLESLCYPETTVVYTGAALWADGRVCWTTMRVRSVVLSYEHIITATTLTRV